MYPSQGMSASSEVRITYYQGNVYWVDVWPSSVIAVRKVLIRRALDVPPSPASECVRYYSR